MSHLFDQDLCFERDFSCWQFTTKVLQVFQNLVGWEEESKAGSYKAITLEYTSITNDSRDFFFVLGGYHLNAAAQPNQVGVQF